MYLSGIYVPPTLDLVIIVISTDFLFMLLQRARRHLVSFDGMKAIKDNCLGNFSTCKKAEDASIGLIHSCNGTTPTPPTTSESTSG